MMPITVKTRVVDHSMTGRYNNDPRLITCPGEAGDHAESDVSCRASGREVVRIGLMSPLFVN